MDDFVIDSLVLNSLITGSGGNFGFRKIECNQCNDSFEKFCITGKPYHA